MKRRIFLKTAVWPQVSGFKALSKFRSSAERLEFPLLDLHVHLTDRFSINQAMELAQERDARFGIVEHPGWA
jgi:hypothetical protein